MKLLLLKNDMYDDVVSTSQSKLMYMKHLVIGTFSCTLHEQLSIVNAGQEL